MTQAFERTAIQRAASLLGVLAAAWLCIGATTLQDRGTQSDQEACTPDVFRLCSAQIPDEPQILACLQSKLDQLSPACSRVMAPAPVRHRRKRDLQPPT